eukprot:1141997-Pelagomonas_calceolata.AAC.10
MQYFLPSTKALKCSAPLQPDVRAAHSQARRRFLDDGHSDAVAIYAGHPAGRVQEVQMPFTLVTLLEKYKRWFVVQCPGPTIEFVKVVLQMGPGCEGNVAV